MTEDDFPTPSASVRLTGSSFSYAGTVEVLHEGRWGAICDQNWDLTDARIFCRQLGHVDAVGALVGSLYGDGNRSSWMNNVDCVGTEPRIEDCRFDGWYENRCGEGQSAGVVCSKAEIKYLMT